MRLSKRQPQSGDEVGEHEDAKHGEGNGDLRQRAENQADPCGYADAARLIVHLVRTEALGAEPSIAIACDQYEEIAGLVRRADPWVLEQAPVERVGADWHPAAAAADLAFVCGLPEAAALSEAIEIAP